MLHKPNDPRLVENRKSLKNKPSKNKPSKNKPSNKSKKKGAVGRAIEKLGKAGLKAMPKIGMPTLGIMKWLHHIIAAVVAGVGAMVAALMTTGKWLALTLLVVVILGLSTWFLVRYITSPCRNKPASPKWCDMTNEDFWANGCVCKSKNNKCVEYLPDDDSEEPESPCDGETFEEFVKKGCDACNCTDGAANTDCKSGVGVSSGDQTSIAALPGLEFGPCPCTDVIQSDSDVPSTKYPYPEKPHELSGKQAARQFFDNSGRVVKTGLIVPGAGGGGGNNTLTAWHNYNELLSKAEKNDSQWQSCYDNKGHNGNDYRKCGFVRGCYQACDGTKPYANRAGTHCCTDVTTDGEAVGAADKISDTRKTVRTLCPVTHPFWIENRGVCMENIDGSGDSVEIKGGASGLSRFTDVYAALSDNGKIDHPSIIEGLKSIGKVIVAGVGAVGCIVEPVSCPMAIESVADIF